VAVRAYVHRHPKDILRNAMYYLLPNLLSKKTFSEYVGVCMAVLDKYDYS